MKDTQKLQLKLQSLLKDHPKLRIGSKYPWNNLEFKEIAWVVQDYVNNSGDVTNDDPLQQWLEEYLFYSSQAGNRT